ncbi:carbamoyltransferase [Telluria mixta]|uniref:Carbamoyltransferase n=1 Tax=Telluria mixta TaxID=34071 RepID=A0ABT2C7M8_9BURK|nr:carbamoyltransferase [Telluria mixta]MCS0632674.1 carbamoyltransferase [Telluria mixta]WEM99031.1 carbamoyltransferase [Telluria mixta]
MGNTILGIAGYYHDAAAALVRDGEIVAAAQEERFTRRKHDPSFPVNAINYCLEEGFVDAADLDAIVFYDNPLLTFDRVVQNACAGLRQGPAAGARDLFVQAAGAVLGDKIWVNEHVRQTLGTLGRAGRVLFAEHHMAHAASAFYPSPFDSAAVLTIDGVGEWATTTLGTGRGRTLELFAEIDYPHSLGLLYSAFTSFCGFKVNSGEYKLMGLAPYGRPRYAGRIREHLIDVRTDGSYRLDMSCFGWLDGMAMPGPRFADLFDGPARQPETPITRREMDLAASIQQVTEDIVLKTARHLRRLSGERNLVLAGGVALNCVANGKLAAAGIFDGIWVQPAAGDAGGALGAALLAHHMAFEAPRRRTHGEGDAQRGSYLGPRYSSEEILAFLDRKGYPYRRIVDRDERLAVVAEALAAGKIAGWLSGRMEFGPRALGARSILGDPRNPRTQATMNLKIKFRESFRPFAPAVLRERCAEYFDFDGDSPYMLMVAPVNATRCVPMDTNAFEAGDDDMMAVINQPRSDIPAVTHVDYSARIQTVDRDSHPEFRALIEAFERLTGCPLLVNTSFNVRGEPIVCSPQDAYRCFMRTEMDVLVLEDVVLWRREQPPLPDDEDWRKTYELD